jgi:3'(2'), 5'-bisphosphate nucleotidase
MSELLTPPIDPWYVDKLIKQLLPLVKQASSKVMEIYQQDADFAVDYKEDKSPITKADILSHEIITDGLLQITPDIPIVSEEAGENTNRKNLKSRTFWVVDPIDGTKEFINKNGQFTIGIALIVNNKPMFGIVVAPAKSEIYYGGPGFGSFVIKETGEVETLLVAKEPTGIIMVSKSHTSEPTDAYIKEKYPSAQLADMGSMLKFIEVARGRADAHPRLGTTMKIWDIAPGHAIVEGAGGYVSTPRGRPLDYQPSNFQVPSFVASRELIKSTVL